MIKTGDRFRTQELGSAEKAIIPLWLLTSDFKFFRKVLP
jgi:hypothetical protein